MASQPTAWSVSSRTLPPVQMYSLPIVVCSAAFELSSVSFDMNRVG